MPTASLSPSPPCFLHAGRLVHRPRVGSLRSYAPSKNPAQYLNRLHPNQALQMRCAVCERVQSSRGRFPSLRQGKRHGRRQVTEAGEEDLLRISAEAPRPPCSSTEEQPEASTSEEHHAEFSRLMEDPKMAKAMAMVPLAALSVGSYNLSLKDLTFKKLIKAWKRFADTANYAEILPPLGSQQLSYAKFLELLSHRQIKRIILMDNATCAIVEVPVEGYAASYRYPLSVDRIDETVQFQGAPTDEWDMEKIRYYVELPGNIYEDGYFMDLVKVNMAPLRDSEGNVRHQDLLEHDQTYLELQVVDTGEANIFLDAIKEQLLPIAGIVVLRVIVLIGTWILSFFQRDRTEMQDMIDEYSKFRGTLYNVQGGKSGTGVSFSDVAGVEHAMELVEETIEMLLGDERYQEMGAKAPRGILMEGPPGTGKTFLAKAMAGESGLPFISSNGSEFVEMFEGVAASRVRDLFKTARKIAPAIVFIDEIDAIGKARGEVGGGSSERESGLMQMLYEMDGFSQNDQVLVIGATNRRDSLDDALLRAGRFDRTVHMGLPSTSQRFKILQVHARGKPIPRGGNATYTEDALLRQAAEMTIGYSGAELANLLNEAAILMVRRDMQEISLALVREVMDKRVMGLAGTPLPESPAKRRLAAVSAARAVVISLTPGLPPLQRMSIVPRGENMTRTLFMPQNLASLSRFWQPGKWNAVELKEPLSPYELMTGMLVPLYAARAAEEVFFGPQEATLSTSYEIAQAGQLANYLVVKSCLFPAYRDLALSHSLVIGGKDDPTTIRLGIEYEHYVVSLQRAAHARARKIVQQRRAAIEAVAAEMCENDDLILGHRIIEIIGNTPLSKVQDAGLSEEDEGASSGAAVFSADGAGRPGMVTFSPPAPPVGEEQPAATASVRFADAGAGKSGCARFSNAAVDLHSISDESLQAAFEVLVGRLQSADLTGIGFPEEHFAEVVSQLKREDWAERIKAVRKYGRSVQLQEPFPQPPPPVPDFEGPLLENWINPEAREPIIA